MPSVLAGMSTWRNRGSTDISRDTPARARGLAVFAACLAGGWLAEISADLRKAVAQRRLRDDALYKWPRLLYFTLLTYISCLFLNHS